jgi:hypothetical protein
MAMFAPLFFLCRLRAAFLFGEPGALSMDAFFGAALVPPTLERFLARFLPHGMPPLPMDKIMRPDGLPSSPLFKRPRPGGFFM